MRDFNLIETRKVAFNKDDPYLLERIMIRLTVVKECVRIVLPLLPASDLLYKLIETENVLDDIVYGPRAESETD